MAALKRLVPAKGPQALRALAIMVRSDLDKAARWSRPGVLRPADTVVWDFPDVVAFLAMGAPFMDFIVAPWSLSGGVPGRHRP